MYTQLTLISLLLCGAANAAEFLLPAAPLITGDLAKRQEGSCPRADYTPCPAGNACCPSGAACFTSKGQGYCDQPCYGETCPGGGCCDIGFACPTAGQFACVQTGYYSFSQPPPLTFPTITSFHLGGPTFTSEPPLYTPEPTSSWDSWDSWDSDSSSTTAPESSSLPPTRTSQTWLDSSSGRPYSGGDGGELAGMASSLSPGYDSWVAWAFTWIIGLLPFIA